MTDRPRVLIIADDLTGAMDAAGPFASSGLPTWVAALPDECDPARFARASVVSVNTESRHLAPEAAAGCVEKAWRQVEGETFDIVVKKIDSTLRGNPVAETRALLACADRSRLVVAPAFPAQGRVVRNGAVHVHGVPLAETGFARDALSPALTVPLVQAFAPTNPGEGIRVWSAASFARADRADSSVAIVDASSDDELAMIAATALSEFERWLLVGSAGLTTALARALAVPGGQPEPPAVLGRIIYVVGSRAPASREQVSALAADGARLVEAVNGRLHKEPVLSPGADVLLVAVPDKQGQEGDAFEVATMLARHAIRLVGAGNAQAIVATGGDTAIACLRISGNPALAVGGELIPGIAYARLMIGTRPVWLVTKAGGFGDADALIEIGRRLRVRAPVTAPAPAS
jgi:uncharacterized protein YgbK (DUF1537 family)